MSGNRIYGIFGKYGELLNERKYFRERRMYLQKVWHVLMYISILENAQLATFKMAIFANFQSFLLVILSL